MGQVVLVDTMVILRCHADGCWAPLVGRYDLETVEKCIEETQTGALARPPSERIDEKALVADFKAVHPVTDAQLAEVLIRGGTNLHDGEQHLWAHALSRPDAWVLCGPDTASMKFGFAQGCRDRLVSVGGLFGDIGFKPRTPLPAHFERAWLERLMTKLLLGEL